jgi:exodeoxyribonuclease VII large subunit
MEKTQQATSYLSVTALSAYLKRKFDADPHLAKVYLTGEISNLKQRRSAHLYFSLKDPDGKAVINATMWGGVANKLKFQPEEGMKVNAIGRVQLYEPNGSHSIILETMEPDGEGALYKALEQLKAKLQAEGLFQQAKQVIPKFPKKIAVITSPSGAVIEDIAQTVARRYPIAQVVLFPAKVQGDGAAEQVRQQLQRIIQLHEYDVVILGRGGGSIEDLWAFNDEQLARDIAKSPIPIISSVGHETDNTIADFVADQRASTPTAAAEMATPITLVQLQTRLQELHLRQIQAVQRLYQQRSERLERVASAMIFQQPDRLYTGYQQQVDLLRERLIQRMEQRLNRTQQRLQLQADKLPYIGQRLLATPQERLRLLSAQLHLVSPLTTLARGFAIVQDEQAQVVRSITDLQTPQTVTIRLTDGQVRGEITEILEKNHG